MTGFHEGVRPPINPHDVWAADSQRQIDRLADMRRTMPEFLKAADAWAQLLLDGKTPAYEEEPQPVYGSARTQVPYQFAFERPPNSTQDGEWISFSAAEFSAHNPMVHLALDAAVKARNPRAFVATAETGLFDDYHATGDARDPVEYYVLGNQDDTNEHPSATAERAIAIHPHTPFASLAPRTSRSGVLARIKVKEAKQRAYEERERRTQAAHELGAGALQLLAASGVTSISAELRTRYGLESASQPEGVAREALSSIWITRGDGTGKTVPRTLQELQDNVHLVAVSDVMVALARLFPDDTPEQLAVRLH